MSNIISVTATTGAGTQLPTLIHDWTVFLVSGSGSGLGVILPANADVGVLVELHNSPTAAISPASGDTYVGAQSPSQVLIRKINATTWSMVAS
jgi:hypothetical protein